MGARSLVATLLFGAGWALGCSRVDPPPASQTVIDAPVEPSCPDRIRIELRDAGASPTELETTVVLPVEHAMGSIHGLEHVYAAVTEGHASVWIDVTAGTLELAKGEVVGALAELHALPEHVERPIVVAATPRRTVHVVASRGPLPMLGPAVDALERALLSTAGVVAVGRPLRSVPRLSVSLDPARLRAFGLDAYAVIEALRGSPLDLTGSGLLRTQAQGSVEDLSTIVVATPGGTPVLLRDLAELRIEPDPDGARGWSGAAAVELLLVDGPDAAAIERVVGEAAPPPAVRHALFGHAELDGCGPPATGPKLRGDLELFDIRLPHGTPREGVEALVHRAPASADAIWMVGGPAVLGDGSSRDPGRVQLLIATTSPSAAALAEWVAGTPGLAAWGHYGHDDGHVVVELRAQSTDALQAAAARLVAAAADRGLHASTDAGSEPRVDVELDREAAARHGMTTHDVARAVRFALHGETVGTLRVDGRELAIHVEASAGSRDPAQLEWMTVPTTTGGAVPLGQVAQLRRAVEPALLRRVDGERVHYVTVWAQAGDRAATEATIDADLLPAIGRDDPGVHARRVE